VLFVIYAAYLHVHWHPENLLLLFVIEFGTLLTSMLLGGKRMPEVLSLGVIVLKE